MNLELKNAPNMEFFQPWLLKNTLPACKLGSVTPASKLVSSVTKENFIRAVYDYDWYQNPDKYVTIMLQTRAAGVQLRQQSFFSKVNSWNDSFHFCFSGTRLPLQFICKPGHVQRWEPEGWPEVLLHEPVREVPGQEAHPLEARGAGAKDHHDHHTSTYTGSREKVNQTADLCSHCMGELFWLL